MSSVKIVRLSAGNATILNDVAEDVFDNAVVPVRAEAFLETDNHFMVVALSRDMVVGMGSAVVLQHPDKNPQLFVNEVGVDPAWQRQGIARQIMAELFAIGKEQDCDEAWLGTELDNGPARALYRSLEPNEEEEFVLYTYELK